MPPPLSRSTLSLILFVALVGCDVASGGGDGTLSASGLLVGERVALDGDLAVVGAVGSNKAFVFKRDADGWSPAVQLVPSVQIGPDPGFSQALDASDGVVVIGSPQYGIPLTAPVRAYVYERAGAGWAETALLLAERSDQGGGGGISVSVSGPRIALGAGGEACAPGPTGPECGRIRVFERSSAGWALAAVVGNPAERPFVGFATDVALDGDRLASGVFTTIATDPSVPGRVYTFRPSGGTWAAEAYAEGPVGATRAFGREGLALDGETLVVTDPIRRPNGAVYVFRWSGAAWALEAELTEPDLGGLATFGRQVDLDGDRLIVAVPGRSYDGRTSGAAFVYTRSSGGTWAREAELRSPDGEVGFGRDVAISGDRALVGRNDSESDGRAYEFVREGGSWRPVD